MSGCVPTNDQVNTHLCIGCHKAVNHCECLWSNFQDLSEIVSDLAMNIDNLTRRMSEMERLGVIYERQ